MNDIEDDIKFVKCPLFVLAPRKKEKKFSPPFYFRFLRFLY